MSPTLHLYHTPGSCSLATHIALQASGLPFSTTNLNAARGFPASHLHLNPKGRVPILEVDGELITETPAILSVIATLVPEKGLLGKGLIAQARAQEPGRFVGDEAMFDAIRAKGREHVRECFEYIEKNLEGKTWVVGDSFTVVDAYLLVFYRWGNMLKMGMRQTYPSYARVVDGVVAQDDVKRTIESEAISVLNE
ncbi:unnamed protein product [Alternaria alternata]